MNEELDVAVVGGGLSGLAAAALLARRGRKVTVFEGSSRLGGEGQSPKLHGIPVNLGPHALYLGGHAAKVLRELGITWNVAPPPLKGAQVWHQGQLVPLPNSALGFLATPLLGWSERLAFARVLLPLLRSPRGSARPDESVDAWLMRTCSAPTVRQLMQLFFRLTTYANAPAVMSAEVACRQLHVGLTGNVTYLPFSGLVAALAALADGNRGPFTIETSRAVRKVHPDGRLVFDGFQARAKTIVIALPLSSALKVFEDDRLKSFAATATASRAACLDLVLSALPNPAQKFVLGMDQPLYASVHRQTAEGVVLQAARYLAPGEHGSAARPALEAMLDAFQPGWREKVLAERFLPEMTVTPATPAATNAGKGFGIELGGRVFVAADWAVGGLLTDGGLQAAHEIAEREASSVRLAG